VALAGLEKEVQQHGVVLAPVEGQSKLPGLKDVKDAVAKKQLPNARVHYVLSGYFENRMPRRIAVDERWYVATYRDVGEALKKTHWKTAQEHYEDIGYKEGRLPHPGFSL
jgi:hypothetical protein